MLITIFTEFEFFLFEYSNVMNEINVHKNFPTYEESKHRSPLFQMRAGSKRTKTKFIMLQPKNFTGNLPQYIAPFEVVVHNKPNNCWVSFLGKVLNITPLLKEFEGQACVNPLIAFAGKDISHWFDEKTGDIQHYVHPITGARVPYCPYGRIPHVEPQIPSSNWNPPDCKPWWNDKKYFVGYLTKRVRSIVILNTCIFEKTRMDVCSEDTIYRIWERYSIYNSDPDSYLWRCNGKNLQLDKTLEENEVPDERDRLTSLGLPGSLYTPQIFIYYMDDFKYDFEELPEMNYC